MQLPTDADAAAVRAALVGLKDATARGDADALRRAIDHAKARVGIRETPGSEELKLARARLLELTGTGAAPPPTQ